MIYTYRYITQTHRSQTEELLKAQELCNCVLCVQEVSSRLCTLRLNISSAVNFMNDLSGFTCSTVQSGVYIYPHLSLPHTAHTMVHTHTYSNYSRLCIENIKNVWCCVVSLFVRVCRLQGCVTAGDCWRIRVCVSALMIARMRITHTHTTAFTSGTHTYMYTLKKSWCFKKKNIFIFKSSMP